MLWVHTNYLPSNTFLYHIWQLGSSLPCFTQSFVAVWESGDVQFSQFENLESSECTTGEKCRKCTILLANPFVGVIMTPIGLFPVGSLVGMGDCRNEFELYWVQAIHPCWNNLLHNDLYSFQADRALPAVWKNESSKEETEDWSTTT